MADDKPIESSSENGDGSPDEPSSPVDDSPVESSKTFSQADLDKKIAEVLNQQKKKYGDYKDLKKAADELNKLKEAQMSETEKLQQQLQDLTTSLTTVKQEAQKKVVESAIIREASKLNFNDPADAVALIGTLEFDESGNPVGVSEAVSKLAEQRKYLLKNQRQLESFNPSGDNQPEKETDAQRRVRLYGGGTQLFTVESAEQSGGGVIWNEPPPKK